jgi:hypothetical protein
MLKSAGELAEKAIDERKVEIRFFNSILMFVFSGRAFVGGLLKLIEYLFLGGYAHSDTRASAALFVTSSFGGNKPKESKLARKIVDLLQD